ncbi:MAG: hypothetical protein KKC79_02905 [Gammaproteobacteria bacterium]|nr:hypothetical protein [Gammaproteobacteria bacterium]MBU1443446.1 hypothetical protein [Gammaproteobacteria bacterium]MBU2286664.1 hypothetical protein [Gammaproteobacteria bacterium]MBU2407579.1 hypothetical protein [Gammaproteobacteria bacterium]
MHQIRISSDSASLQNLPLQQGLLALFARTAAMGVLNDEHVTAIDPASMRGLVDDLQEADLLRSARVDLAPLLHQSPEQLDARTAEHMLAEVSKLVETLDESPSPVTEWAPMREVFGDEALAMLVGVAPASLRRYAAATRATPQPVAERLHWLAMVVADLAGGYNAFGIRRWFERPRVQLDGLSPRQALGDDWSVDDAAAARVRALAATLSGAQPLAV